MNVPTIDILWFTAPPNLDNILLRSNAWIESYPGEPVEVQSINVDSIGIFPLAITVRVKVQGDVFNYHEVDVEVNNVARKQKWKPGLDWYRHVFGVPDFVIMQNDFRKKLADDIHALLMEREGVGISMIELELIVASIYNFVGGMDEDAHQVRQQAKEDFKNRCPFGRRQHLRREDVIKDTGVEPGAEETSRECIAIDAEQEEEQNETDQYKDMPELVEVGDGVHRDEDNQKVRASIWKAIEQESGGGLDNVVTAEEARRIGQKQWDESFNEFVNLE
ncbi:hypothetical protein KVT40_004027 [Elsinoe batatas]|uniref:Uncharacterized protein n=1 Tax=Elsinoe batatas TaxID=2601811 RepID=A0A8K0PJV5_9PEZI|nr:hypothetical protein KVT40_004027 [Elsinoe batatas]